MSEQKQIAIPKAKVQLPANYQEEMAAEAAEIAKRVAAPSGDTIKVLKDKTFELPNGDTLEVLTGVIVDFVSNNQYYGRKFDATDIKPPICFALGTDIDDMKPSPQSTDIQSEECKTCWANQWGTDGKGKACKNQRLVAIVPPEMQATGPLLLLKVAPTGVRYFDQHISGATTLAGGMFKVVTEFVCDPAPDYASLRFKVLGPNEDFAEAYSRKKGARARLLTEPDYGTAPAEKAAAAATKPKGKGK